MTPQTDPWARDVGRDLVALREELRRMADEIDRAVRTSSLDLRHRWNRLKPRLEDFEERSSGDNHGTAAQLFRTGLYLRERLAKLRGDCRR